MVHSQTKKAGLASLDRNFLCKRNSLQIINIRSGGRAGWRQGWEWGQSWAAVDIFLTIVSTLTLRPEEDFVFPLNLTVEKSFASFPQICGLRCLTWLVHFNNISTQDCTHTGFPLLSTQWVLPTKIFLTSSLKHCR